MVANVLNKLRKLQIMVHSIAESIRVVEVVNLQLNEKNDNLGIL